MSTRGQTAIEPTEDELLILAATSLLKGETLGIKMAFKKITSSKHATKILRKLFKLLTLKRTMIRKSLRDFIVNSGYRTDDLPNTWTAIGKFKSEQIVINTIASEVLSRKELFGNKKITTFNSPGNNLLLMDNKLLREIINTGLLEIGSKFSIYGGSKKTYDLAAAVGGIAANLNRLYYDFGYMNFGGTTTRDAIYTYSEAKDMIASFVNNTNENISFFRDIYLAQNISTLDRKHARMYIFLQRQKFLNNFLDSEKFRQLFRTTFLADRSPIKDNIDALAEPLEEMNLLIANSMIKYTKEDLKIGDSDE